MCGCDFGHMGGQVTSVMLGQGRGWTEIALGSGSKSLEGRKGTDVGRSGARCGDKVTQADPSDSPVRCVLVPEDLCSLVLPSSIFVPPVLRRQRNLPQGWFCAPGVLGGSRSFQGEVPGAGRTE